MSDIVIRVEHLSKRYKIGKKEASYKMLRDTLTDVFAGPFQRVRTLFQSRPTTSGDSSNDTIWALKDVSFEVKRGEVVGIIGRNGAGKSTLLTILSRITEPTEGSVEIHGRVGSLLEVGTGFHPELTGRENIYLNAAILGMKKLEIERRFDEIVSFAEIERFIDTPVKHYSSGMYVRLAFAVAAHLDPEILLVDEVLAVGDFRFQEKCLKQMGKLGKEGKTVMLVTHNVPVIPKLCGRAILIDQGRVAVQGEPRDVVERYLQKSIEVLSVWTRKETPTVNRGIVITEVKVCNHNGKLEGEISSDKPYYIEVGYVVSGSNIGSRIVLEVETEDSIGLFATTDCDFNDGIDRLRMPGQYRCRCEFPPHLLAPGTYYVTALASWTQRIEWDRVPRAVKFNISRVGSLQLVDRRAGVMAPILRWEPL